MKALQFAEKGRARSPSCRPRHIADDEVLVAARSVGVCHSDIDLLEGRYIIPFDYPLIPGHEWSGEVVAVGPKVTGFAARRPRGRGVRDRRRPLRLLDQRRRRGVLRREARLAAPPARRALLHDGCARRAVQRRLLRDHAGRRRRRERHRRGARRRTGRPGRLARPPPRWARGRSWSSRPPTPPRGGDRARRAPRRRARASSTRCWRELTGGRGRERRAWRPAVART